MTNESNNIKVITKENLLSLLTEKGQQKFNHNALNERKITKLLAPESSPGISQPSSKTWRCLQAIKQLCLLNQLSDIEGVFSNPKWHDWLLLLNMAESETQEEAKPWLNALLERHNQDANRVLVLLCSFHKHYQVMKPKSYKKHENRKQLVSNNNNFDNYINAFINTYSSSLDLKHHYPAKQWLEKFGDRDLQRKWLSFTRQEQRIKQMLVPGITRLPRNSMVGRTTILAGMLFVAIAFAMALLSPAFFFITMLLTSFVAPYVAGVLCILALGAAVSVAFVSKARILVAPLLLLSIGLLMGVFSPGVIIFSAPIVIGTLAMGIAMAATFLLSYHIFRRIGKILAEFGAYEEKIGVHKPNFSELIVSPLKRVALFSLGHKVDDLNSPLEAPFRLVIGALYTFLMVIKLIASIVTAPFHSQQPPPNQEPSSLVQAASGVVYGLAQMVRGLVDGVTTPLTWFKCAVESVVAAVRRTDPHKATAERGLQLLEEQKSQISNQQDSQNRDVPIAVYSKACKLDATPHSQSHHSFFKAVEDHYLGYKENDDSPEPEEIYFKKFTCSA